MTAASDLYVEGPFVDRNAVIVPVSPGRSVALGDSATATGPAQLRLADGDAVRISQTGRTSQWGITSWFGFFPPSPNPDHILNIGSNITGTGQLLDPTDFAWGFQLERDYDPGGGARWSEMQLYYEAPGGAFKRRILDTGYNRTSDKGAITVRGEFTVTETANASKLLFQVLEPAISGSPGRCYAFGQIDHFGSSLAGNPDWSFRTNGSLWTWGKSILSHTNNHGIYFQLNAALTNYSEVVRLDNQDRVVLGKQTGVVATQALAVRSDCPHEFPSYTVAQLLAGTPSATTAARQVWCSDHFGGARMAYSDGSTWRDLRTGLVVS